MGLSHNHTQMICLVNEPDWGNNTVDPREDLYKASPLGLKNFSLWLEKKYGTVEKLSEVWGAPFSSFDEAAFERDHRSSDHKASWYDWCRFKQQQVLSWIAFKKEVINEAIPEAMLYAKVTNEMTFMASKPALGKKLYTHPHGDTGIDREAWIDLMDVNGCDTRTISAVYSPIRSRWEKPDQYVINWFGQGLGYDFMKSLSPDKMIFETEWHAVNTVLYATPELPENHMSAAVWLAHVYGVGMNWLWYWSRMPDGQPLRWSSPFFYGSLMAQPKVLDSYVLSMSEVNLVADTLASFSKQEREVCLLYSEASSIQSLEHRDSILDAYEALTFTGYTVGFTTEKRIKEDPMAPQVLVLPRCSYVEDATVEALRKRIAAGGEVIVLGDEPLAFTSQGAERSEQELAFLSKAPHLDRQAPQELRSELEKRMPPSEARDFLVGDIPWGMIVRKTFSGGDEHLFFANVTTQPLSVKLEPGRAWACELTGSAYDTSTVTLEPGETLLLSSAGE